MPVALSPNSFEHFVFKEDRHLPEADQPKFHVKLMNFRELCAFEDALADLNAEGSGTKEAYKACVAALKLCLVPPGWTNYKYADGKPVNFDEMFAQDFPCFTPVDMQLLISGAMTVNKLTEEESKNSNSSPESLKETSSKDTDQAAPSA